MCTVCTLSGVVIITVKIYVHGLLRHVIVEAIGRHRRVVDNVVDALKQTIFVFSCETGQLLYLWIIITYNRGRCAD